MSDGPAFTLETCKNAARRLRKSHAAGDPDALARVALHVAPDKTLKHADFLHVIAREDGHDSWPKLKFALETAAMSRAERAERLKMALYFGQHWVTEKLLAADPTLKDDNLGLQIALYDLDAVTSALNAKARAATNRIGVRTPILHLAFSREIHRSPDKQSDMLSIAELLVGLGADINDGYQQDPGSDHKISALYGALCHADNYELGKWLLERGANPNDDESLYHATELDHTRALELLLKHGALPDGSKALPRALDFDDPDKVRLLLEAGADPNITVPDHPSGMPMNTVPSLHQAVRRGRSARFVELLLEFGADPTTVWIGHTAYGLARIHGNREASELLQSKGLASSLSPNEQILADCADLKKPSGKLDMPALCKEDRCLLTELVVRPVPRDHLNRLIEAGLDPDQVDYMGLPPLHLAGWNGLVSELRFFLSFGPDLARKNDYGGDALDTVLHGSEFAPARTDADHLTCARLLLDAGSELHPHHLTGCGNEGMVAFLEEWQQTRS